MHACRSTLEDPTLVDPDNRRPVDFEHRQRLLTELHTRAQDDLGALADELVAAWPDERIKLFTVWRALTARREHADLFRNGNYLPLAVDGPLADHVCTFAREHEGRWAAIIAPRLSLSILREPVLVGEAEQELGADLQFSGVTTSPTEARAHCWRDTAIALPIDAPANWRNIFTAARLSARSAGDQELLDLSDALARFPIALLIGGE